MTSRNSETNSNCLAGMHCFKCGSRGPFRSAVTAIATIHDSGSDDIDQLEWNDNSFCACAICGHEATVAMFNDDDGEGES